MKLDYPEKYVHLFLKLAQVGEMKQVLQNSDNPRQRQRINMSFFVVKSIKELSRLTTYFKYTRIASILGGTVQILL